MRASSLSKVGTFWQTFDDKPGEELEGSLVPTIPFFLELHAHQGQCMCFAPRSGSGHHRKRMRCGRSGLRSMTFLTTICGRTTCAFACCGCTVAMVSDSAFRIWYPFLLNGKCFKGRCHFGSSKDFTEMKWHNFQECAEAPADEQH